MLYLLYKAFKIEGTKILQYFVIVRDYRHFFKFQVSFACQRAMLVEGLISISHLARTGNIS